MEKTSFWSGSRSSHNHTKFAELQHLWQTNTFLNKWWGFTKYLRLRRDVFFTKNWKHGFGLMFSRHTPQRRVQFVLGFFGEYVYQNKPETRYQKTTVPFSCSCTSKAESVIQQIIFGSSLGSNCLFAVWFPVFTSLGGRTWKPADQGPQGVPAFAGSYTLNEHALLHTEKWLGKVKHHWVGLIHDLWGNDHRVGVFFVAVVNWGVI